MLGHHTNGRLLTKGPQRHLGQHPQEFHWVKTDSAGTGGTAPTMLEARRCRLPGTGSGTARVPSQAGGRQRL